MCQYEDELAASSAPLHDDELVAYLLAGLNEDYNLVFTAMVARVDPISPGELYAQLLSFEQHMTLQGLSSPVGSPSTMVASRGRDYNGGGRGTGSSNHNNGCGCGRGHTSWGGSSNNSGKTGNGSNNNSS
jgi:hypothetical protein